MRKILTGLFAMLLYCSAHAQNQNFWTPVEEETINKNVFANRYKPSAYKLFHLQELSLVNNLLTAPSERNVSPSNSGFILTIPDASGSNQNFRVVEAPVMDPALAAKFPGIQSYAGQGITDPTATIRFDVSPEGFHAMILSYDKPTVYIDPVDRQGKHYVVFSRKDAPNYNAPFHQENKMNIRRLLPVQACTSLADHHRHCEDLQ